MPKIKYVARNFSPKSLGLIGTANEIITEYRGQGFDLTLRQLYYQFVARDVIPNTQRDYKNLGSIINDARLAGLIDWNSIVDRTRNLEKNSHWESPAEIVRATANQYQIDKWATQKTRVEIWIEKDALIGVIEKVCRQNDVSYFSCRGYTSQSELWAGAMRLKGYEDEGQSTVVIHLGDHDPSGKDMSRDIEDRLRLFGADTEVRRVALNMDQVRKYNPPPNPAKLTDSRATGYIKEFGKNSWELDALEPSVLAKLIQDNINEFCNGAEWRKSVKVEDGHKARLVQAAEEIESEEAE